MLAAVLGENTATAMQEGEAFHCLQLEFFYLQLSFLLSVCLGAEKDALTHFKQKSSNCK